METDEEKSGSINERLEYKNKLKFLAKVSKVKGRIKQAQKIGEKLKTGQRQKMIPFRV